MKKNYNAIFECRRNLLAADLFFLCDWEKIGGQTVRFWRVRLNLLKKGDINE